VRAWPFRRRGGFPALGAVLFLAAAGRGQTVFVNVKHGDDANFGGTPERAVQTITRALEVAACDPTIPWTIRVAGAVDREGKVVAYDDDAATCPPSKESFPLSMLSGISLVWDRDNSAVVPTGPDGEEFDFVRPLVRTAFGLSTLVEFSPRALPGSGNSPGLPALQPRNSRVTLSGLDFEGGDPTISIHDNSREAVSVCLRDVTVRAAGTCVDAAVSGFEVDLDFRDSRFEARPSAPFATPQAVFVVDVRASETGVVRTSLTNCLFAADRAMNADPLLRFTSERGGLTPVEAKNCHFESRLLSPISEPEPGQLSSRDPRTEFRSTPFDGITIR
jgi:hypothetical protein